MRQHYYLVSSLYDLLLDGKAPVTLENFLAFSEELLAQEEFRELRKLFLVNDLRNLVRGKPFYRPTCWKEEETAEFLSNPEAAPVFLREWLENKDSGRGKSKVHPLDELLTLFYQHLDAAVSEPLRDWFLFELNLRNVTTAFALRKRRQLFHDFLIPVGPVAQQILSSTALDFGLSQDLPYVTRLIELYEEKQMHSMERDREAIAGQTEPALETLEKYLDVLRWDWLTENWEVETFGTLAVYSYALKLGMVERWNGLNAENGEKLFNKLVNQIKGSIVFSDELFISRGRK